MDIVIKEGVPLAPYTIYKIGGPARFFVEVRSVDRLEEAVRFAEERRVLFFVLGAGSNVLIADRGFDGLIIQMRGGEVLIEGDRLIADAGVMMARAVMEAARAGLGGFEWGIGIPGTIGGAVRGNAGCFGGEMKDVVERVRILQAPSSKPRNTTSAAAKNGSNEVAEVDPVESPRRGELYGVDIRGKFQVLELTNRDCQFNYRDSIFKRHPEWVVLSATLKLKKGDPTAIQEHVKRITAERAQKQDIGTKSCGCIFKNVSWSRRDIRKGDLLNRFSEFDRFGDEPALPASLLIDRVGLKGRRVGKAVISPKHANYFLNEGGATAEEVITLITAAKDAVMRKYGIALEEEIQYVGFARE